MKARIILLLVPCLFFSFAINGQQAEKTLVKAFNLEGNHTVLLDVDADVIINEWPQEQMRVIMTVSLNNGSDMMLKSLVKVGRYNLDSSFNEDGFRVFCKGMDRRVKLKKGGQLQENIHFEVFVPVNTVVTTKNEETVAEKTGSTF